MERKVFPKPAVAGVLTENYGEARLHTDGTTNLERILELQEKLAESVANPIYVTLDPKTETRLGRHEGATLGEGGELEFIRFLEEGVEKARSERVGQAD